ncbi:MAG: hypothetical protein JXR46_12455, partial [Calditrichaceae bacterium]|nr:hypothetical protein [Calditrichaceae bacterium]
TLRRDSFWSGKELDQEVMAGGNLECLSLSWEYYFGARYYPERDACRRDPEIARWHVVDPMAHKVPSLSPYIYCSNSPINRFDPNGMFDYRFDDNLQPTTFPFIIINHTGLSDEELEDEMRRMAEMKRQSTLIFPVYISNEETENKKEKSENNGITNSLGISFTIAGIFTSLNQFKYIRGNRYFNPYYAEWYSMEFFGNNFESKMSRILSIKAGTAFKISSKVLYIASIPISLGQMAYAYQRGDISGVAWGFGDLCAGTAMLGGTMGFGAGILWYMNRYIFIPGYQKTAKMQLKNGINPGLYEKF